MRIQHNIPSMNAYRNYGNNTGRVSGSLEKLSSGYRINRAGDDAAGLAISEKMRAQISGLEVAQKNAKDGISLVQTAEGALSEVQDMLNRMYSLAEQSANGTYDDSVDRAQLQKEVDSLRSEINRISDSANFNGIPLLDGSMSGDTDPHVESITSDNPALVNASNVKVSMSFPDLDSPEDLQKLESDGTLSDRNNADEVKALKTALDDLLSALGSGGFKLSGTVDADWTSINYAIVPSTMGLSINATMVPPEVAFTIDGNRIPVMTLDGLPRTTDTGREGDTVNLTINFSTSGAMPFQIGDSPEDYDKIFLSIDNINTGSLGAYDMATKEVASGITISYKVPKADAKTVADIDISTQQGAAEALDVIRHAINYISDNRGGLGAVQNRLDHTINNLSVMQENMQDAESVIRDTDMASEMMKYTKDNILVQSAQSMLAQANQLPQGVLQLLQG